MNSLIVSLNVSILTLLALVSISLPVLSETSEIELTENLIEFLEPLFTEEYQESENFLVETNILYDSNNGEIATALPGREPLLIPEAEVEFSSPLAQAETIPLPAESVEIENTPATPETPETSETVTEELTETTETTSSEESLAEASQNPIANLISVPFQNNTNFGVGPWDRTQNILNFQPVIPFDLNEDWLLVSRTILPIVYQPPLTVEGANNFGLGDLNPQFFFVPKNNSKWTWGVGPVFLLSC